MSNRCHRWVIDRTQNFWPSISHRLPIIADNQWLISWLPNDYSSITHWCHSSSIWQRLGFFAPLWSENGYRFCTNINHKGLQRTANEYAEEHRIYKDLISKSNNVDMLNSANRILQCWSYSRSTISIAVFCMQNLICLHYYFCWGVGERNTKIVVFFFLTYITIDTAPKNISPRFAKLNEIE